MKNSNISLNSILKKRSLIGVACIILSLLICFVITPLFNNALSAQTQIVRVTEDIQKGEAITQHKLELVKVGSYNLPVNIVKSMEKLDGKFATAHLLKGDFILSPKLTDSPYKENDYLYKLDGTKQAISVSIKSFALGLSGKLSSGDIVSIIASDYGDMRETLIPPELQYVEVLAVTTAKGVDENENTSSHAYESSDKNSSSYVTQSNSNEEKQLPSTVTLLVTTTQARVLADLEAKSKIHIALAYRGDGETSMRFIKTQDEALNRLQSGGFGYAQ